MKNINIKCLVCKASLRSHWLKDGVCNACRNPDSVIISKVSADKEVEEVESYCEECDQPTDSYYKSYGAKFYICDKCQEHLFCECGQRLEDEYGSPGDGLCRKCD